MSFGRICQQNVAGLLENCFRLRLESQGQALQSDSQETFVIDTVFEETVEMMYRIGLRGMLVIQVVPGEVETSLHLWDELAASAPVPGKAELIHDLPPGHYTRNVNKYIPSLCTN